LLFFLSPPNLAFTRSHLAGALALALLASTALAQSASQPPTLRQALDAAWQLSSQSRSFENRRSELAAKEKATNSWISGEPVAGIAHRTDRFSRIRG
jgi:hypothetical protein